MAAPYAGAFGVEKYPSLVEKAAALLYAFAKGHACPNGNKRLACVLTIAFLLENHQAFWVRQTDLTDKISEVAASEGRQCDQVRAAAAELIRERLIDSVEYAIRIQMGRQVGD